MTEKKALSTLLEELDAIETSFHMIADPQLAIAGKMREILTEAVAAVESAATEISSLKSSLASLASRVAALEPGVK